MLISKIKDLSHLTKVLIITSCVESKGLEPSILLRAKQARLPFCYDPI